MSAMQQQQQDQQQTYEFKNLTAYVFQGIYNLYQQNNISKSDSRLLKQLTCIQSEEIKNILELFNRHKNQEYLQASLKQILINQKKQKKQISESLNYEEGKISDNTSRFSTSRDSSPQNNEFQMNNFKIDSLKHINIPVKKMSNYQLMTPEFSSQQPWSNKLGEKQFQLRKNSATFPEFCPREEESLILYAENQQIIKNNNNNNNLFNTDTEDKFSIFSQNSTKNNNNINEIQQNQQLSQSDCKSQKIFSKYRNLNAQIQNQNKQQQYMSSSANQWQSSNNNNELVSAQTLEDSSSFSPVQEMKRFASQIDISEHRRRIQNKKKLFVNIQNSNFNFKRKISSSVDIKKE